MHFFSHETAKRAVTRGHADHVTLATRYYHFTEVFRANSVRIKLYLTFRVITLQVRRSTEISRRGEIILISALEYFGIAVRFLI